MRFSLDSNLGNERLKEALFRFTSEITNKRKKVLEDKRSLGLTRKQLSAYLNVYLLKTSNFHQCKFLPQQLQKTSINKGNLLSND